jgi:membrane protease YdiL (CAAX protease family)
MRPYRSLLIFISVVFIGGALLAPWLYWLVQSLAPDSTLAHSPFPHFVSRSFLWLALLGSWPLARSLGAKSGKELGLVRPAGEWGRLAAGFALGFGSLACLAIIVLAARGRALNHTLTASQLGAELTSAALTALIVSVLEEILFRGAIFGALRRVADWRFALLLSSMIYAIGHFLETAGLNGPVAWTSGLEMLPRMLRGFGNWEVVIPGFFNLTLAGLLLGLAYQRTGTLYFSIGLHAGWIFWLKSFGLLTNPVSDARLWLFGTKKLIDGWLALTVLSVVLAILLRLPPGKPRVATA